MRKWAGVGVGVREGGDRDDCIGGGGQHCQFRLFISICTPNY